MPDFNISPVSIPTSPSLDGLAVGVESPKEKSKDEIFGNVNLYEYSLTNFCAGITKVVRTKIKDRYWITPYKKNADEFKYDEKLSQSISRSRRLILEYALCNDWKWFATLTVNAAKEDRYALKVFYDKFKNNWLKYVREKTGKKIPYLLVPEKHKDGAWHLHGFFNSDVDDMLVPFVELNQAGYRMPSGKRLPLDLVQGDFYDWPAYRKRFGFCSFGKIRDKVHCSFYVTKYITKSLVSNPELQGKRCFYPTDGLQKAVLIGRVYGKTPVLDAVISRDYDFCSTGWYHYEKEIGYDPILDLIEERGEYCGPLDTRVYDLFCETDGLYLPVSFDLDSYPSEIQQEVDEYYEATQMAIKGFEGAAGLGNKSKAKR